MSASTAGAERAPVSVVVIGASAGGIEALGVLLGALPADFAPAVIVVLHIPSDRPSLLPELFRTRCARPLREASDKETVESGTVYFAPPGYHLQLEPDGWLSLAFYNRDALIYRNLLKGHFRKLRQGDYAGAGQRGLTPQRPLDPREVEAWLAADWQVRARSGVRVFHDYMPPEFQTRADGEELVAMELAHRRHPAFAGLGRYLHWLCQAKAG